MKFRKIIVTGNILRVPARKNPKESNQNINISWLYNLLHPTLSQVFKMEVSPLYWTTNSSFDSSYVYQEQGLSVSVENFSYLYDSKKISPSVLDYFKHHFNNCLVIGLELPPIMVKIFDKIGIEYLDFMFHPARFMPDLVMGIRTNSKPVYDKISQYRVNEDWLYSYAGLRRAVFHKQKSTLKPYSALLTGQVYGDTSLITPNGGYYEYKDFAEKIESIIENHEHLYIKQHPLNKETNFLDMFKTSHNISFVNDNFYKLISSSSIVTVSALTSSTVYESRYFGKNSSWLAPYPFDFSILDQSFNKFRYVPIFLSFLKADFWRHLYSDVDANPSIQTQLLEFESGILRKSLGVDWGFDVFK